MSSSLLLVNGEKPKAVAASERLRGVLGRWYSDVVELVVSQDDTGPIVAGDLGGVVPDRVVVVGGDGTLLAQARRVVDLGSLVIGVNVGRLGFLADFSVDAVERHAEWLFGAEPPRALGRMMLRVDIEGGPARKASGVAAAGCIALNDAAVLAGPPFRMIELRCVLDGSAGPTVRGDGLIVSTATGSTGYGVSAGGPVLSPEVDGMVVTPLAAHTLSFRPLVLPQSAVLEVVVESANEGEDGGRGSTLVLDGQVQHAVFAGDRIVVRRYPRDLLLVSHPERTFWDTLTRKMHWATMPGRPADTDA